MIEDLGSEDGCETKHRELDGECVRELSDPKRQRGCGDPHWYLVDSGTECAESGVEVVGLTDDLGAGQPAAFEVRELRSRVDARGGGQAVEFETCDRYCEHQPQLQFDPIAIDRRLIKEAGGALKVDREGALAEDVTAQEAVQRRADEIRELWGVETEQVRSEFVVPSGLDDLSRVREAHRRACVDEEPAACLGDEMPVHDLEGNRGGHQAEPNAVRWAESFSPSRATTAASSYEYCERSRLARRSTIR